MIQIGDTLPAVTLQEYLEEPAAGCGIGPNPVDVRQAAQGKTIALFAVPGAFTPVCSAQHAPGYLARRDALKAAGIDEIWCTAVNDAFVLGAWARALEASGKIRFLADGNADFAKAMGLTADMSARGLGTRSARYSALIKNGKVAALNVDAPGKFEASDADTLLTQARQG
ncbi:MAG: peroxiredoxin [Burkholderiaceae bacterium]|jgi:peroxiredoxin|nr:peroxiredoxin [Burkholderiaceae bacterium]